MRAHARTVFTTKVEPNYGQPWQMCPQRSGTGSAFVIDIDKRYILSNAHVVSGLLAQRPEVYSCSRQAGLS
jgi:S1-C subfamily serine protease